ncbi:hypothetical protein [Flavobacterium fluviatile]|uniref:hypothetical protein n=1 Tax=Flavobacterium fluviatile TaxID=1862387 RepID=UPI0013D1EC8E|nr:hypothetical protein [Flavobacterium fluviatile]
MTTTKAYTYTGTGSAIDDYMKPKQQLKNIVRGNKTDNKNWGLFDPKHKYAKVHKLIRSICITKEWSVPSERWGKVADLDKLSDFLKSDKSPVKKPLMDMDKKELEKLIVALNSIVVHHWNKKI